MRDSIKLILLLSLMKFYQYKDILNSQNKSLEKFGKNNISILYIASMKLKIYPKDIKKFYLVYTNIKFGRKANSKNIKIYYILFSTIIE